MIKIKKLIRKVLGIHSPTEEMERIYDEIRRRDNK